MACNLQNTDKNITTTLVVNFSKKDGSKALLKAEIDNRPKGYNQGKTSFAPGDDVYFFVFHSVNVELDLLESSAGQIYKVTDEVICKDQTLSFAHIDTVSLSYPATAITNRVWFGNDLGSILLVGQTTAKITEINKTGVAEIDYDTIAHVYKLTGVPTVLGGKSEYSVTIYIEGHEI